MQFECPPPRTAFSNLRNALIRRRAAVEFSASGSSANPRITPVGLRSIAFIASAVGGLVVYGLASYFPAFPKSVVGWAALAFLGIPLLLGAEWLGDRFLGSKLLARCSSVTRVAIAIAALLAFLIGFVPIFTFVSSLIRS